MSNAAATPAVSAEPAARANVAEIFTSFLFVGSVSFGGGVVAYLRSLLVAKKKWLDDQSFLELMSISNTLPGLNATNMSILAGDRLAGAPGSIAAMLGMCLPGFVLLTLGGVLYAQHHNHPVVGAMLKGVGAAAVGLIGATWYQIGKKTVRVFNDAFFILAAVVCIHQFKLSVPVTLLAIGAVAIFANRPHVTDKGGDEWIRSLR